MSSEGTFKTVPLRPSLPRSHALEPHRAPLGRRVRNLKRLLVITVVSVAVIASAWTWVFGTTDCLEIYPGLPEGSAFHNEGKLWPPGTRCVYELPTGRHEERTAFP